ncbi:unnamed protein product [Acanthoscelides obtectus]|uniref:Uncharacterized protein n=1 Tax=Acanthoscelides obtectus TaxID=200917 RepID=A0A9P0LYB2_ACAOB|nr:unnamed protein product [Acanthoscelides obtectus]CAK1647781.1 hypothetical protein AOBTE_LOCUS15394 [Acanthoscelides obtectus]
MESHFCRQSTTREYLHPDLTIEKMYYFYVQEGRQPQCSYHTYRRVFKSLNLSFHHPKKDQCSLCSSYKEGSTETKAKLEDSFAAHIAEKDSARKKKKDAKESSQENPEVIASAVFDLQQFVAEQPRIRQLRKFDTGENVNFTAIKEVMVKKDVPHLADQYNTLSLKRNTLEVLKQPVRRLNNGPIKLDSLKYENLVELCTGPTPIVRDLTFQQYFKNLPNH